MSQETSLLETMTGLFFAQTDILPVGDITIYESQLLGAYDSPTVAVSIRNPGYRPTYSYGLARTISKNLLTQAWLISDCRLELS